ncbi:hypothetical protein N7492_005424 [Penicillium capsulatum]|uniref:Uncharacterized protein n=1 Tax=Penicillium capsulatum TaxID=69766 RepID=A0A9W9ICF3_9EURO|nr:hypothetical protein N7492_005424 [Penicillium capsulatum]KAJ6135479.1 hypothetical protein N7512_000639 [Penicillium capsulatum]
MSFNTPGYAIRRNSSCGDEEVKCHKTWENDLAITMACCPKDSHCNNSGQPNTICCPNGLNCTQEIESKRPTCADQRWDLYDKDGEFCCEKDQWGYFIDNSIWVGCYTNSGDVNGKYIGLPVISTGSASTATAKSSSAASTATSTSSAAAGASTGGSSTNTGAIAGGVVGGVVGAAAILVALFFLLRSRKRKDQPPSPPQQDTPPPVISKNSQPRELEGQTHSKPAVEAVLEYPPQPEYPAYNMPAYDYYSQSHQVSSSDYSQPPHSLQGFAPSQPHTHSSPSEYATAQPYLAQQLHELPTDRNSHVDSK